MDVTSRCLKETDPELFDVLDRELGRQREYIEMIPSENFVSLAVLGALGSVLTNKYSEGYPGKRYYGGNQFIDVIENLAISRAKKLFGVPHVNVQPYSGSPANFAVYAALCNPGDTIMGQNLLDGGHLTHGWRTSVTGQLFKSVAYHVRRDGYLDVDEVRKLARSSKPRMIWIGATAYTRALPFKEFAEIADEVGAYLVADISHISGLVIAGVHESPVKYAHIITTTTHKTLRGPRGAMIMVTQKGLDKDPELADKIDKTVFPGLQGGPHDNAVAGVAVALKEASKPEFRAYARQVVKNAKALAAGLSEGGLPLVTGGTDNHMVLVDLTKFGKGKGVFAQEALDAAGIVVNKNTIPNEQSSPFYPSGIRLGTPAVTTRGMREPQMAEIASIIAEVVNEAKGYELPESKEGRAKVLRGFRTAMARSRKIKAARHKTLELCRKFPIYNELGG